MPAKDHDPVWDTIRKEYQEAGGKITLRALALKYDKKPAAVSQRCHRERWSYNSLDTLTNTVSSAVIKTVEKKVERLTDDATRFVAQQLRTSFMLSNKLEKRFESEADSLKPKDLQSLTGAWKNTVDIGRQALRLDDQKDNALHFHLHGAMKPDPNALTIDAETVPSTPPAAYEADSAEPKP